MGDLRPTHAGRAWWVVSGGIIALVVVLVFILENLRSVTVHFFGASWRCPLALDLLFAAVLGGLVVFLLGTVRIVQLRRTARRRVRPRSVPAVEAGPSRPSESSELSTPASSPS